MVKQLMSKRYGAWLSLLLLSPVACGGCGVSHDRAATRPTYHLEQVYVLARAELPGDRWARVLVKRYLFARKQISEVSYSVEARHAHEFTEGGGGPLLQPTTPAFVRFEFGHGCIERTNYTLALGILHDARDSAFAYEHGTSLRFKRAVLPPYFHSKEAVVFAVLGASGAVVVRRKGGATIYRESFGEPDRTVCDRAGTSAAER